MRTLVKINLKHELSCIVVGSVCIVFPRDAGSGSC